MIENLTISSKAIKGFPMQDPHERKLPVYLPPKYDPKRAEAYPVIFLLSGWGGRSSKYLSDDSPFEIPLEQKLDQAIAKGELPPAILAFPDGTSKLGSSQYINSPALGHYMDYIADEIVEFIDSKFHTHRAANFRGIMGHSSGGFGALAHGFLRPDRFQFICSSAGDSGFDISMTTGIAPTLIELERASGIENFVDDFFKQPQPSSAGQKKIVCLNMLSSAACYAPNLTKPPLYGDLFFDLKTGEIIEEIWQKYLNWDPIHLIDRHEELSRELKFVHLEAGLQDEYGAQFGHRRLAKKLKHLQIPHQIDEYPGGHSGHNWRILSRIKLMLEKMLPPQ